MKNLFKKTMLFAAAAMAFASCSNDTTEDVALAPAVKISLTATLDDTRSEFGDYNSTDNAYPTLWSGDEDWAIAMNDRYKKLSNENFSFSDDHKTANATLEFDAGKTPTADSNSEYTLCAVSPYSAFSSYSQEYSTFRYTIKASQEPTANSCDAAAQVLIAKSAPMPSLDSSFALQFKHATAYAKFSFTNVAEATVSGVSIEAEEGVNLAGRYQYSLEDGTITSVDGLSTSISLTTSTTENLWVACAPVDVSGKKLTFTIITDKGNLVKEVTMPANCTFTAGRIATFTVNMNGITFPEATGDSYELVTSLADITAGEYVITNSTFVLPNSSTSSKPTAANLATKATISGTTLTNVADDVKWIFTGTNTAMSIQSYADTKNYLFIGSDSNTGLKVSTPSGDTKWEFMVNGTGFSMRNNSRYCGVYNSQDWRSYNSATHNNYADSGILKLYKKTTGEGGEEPEASIESATIENVVAVGGDFEYTPVISNSTSAIDDNIQYDGTVVTEAIVVDGVVLYTVAENTGNAREGWFKLALADDASVTATITVKQLATEQGGGDEPGTGEEVTVSYTFSDYTAGAQYAENEVHELDDVLTITTTQCHFTTQLRIYGSNDHDGIAIGQLTKGTKIKSLGFNMGYKVDRLVVYGSNDGSTWTEVGTVATTATTYKDYTLDFGNTSYTYFKLDAMAAQIRIAKLTLTYEN